MTRIKVIDSKLELVPHGGVDGLGGALVRPVHHFVHDDVVLLRLVDRAGGNCIKIGLPGKSILGYYFQENRP